jgi:predicted transcriptional regulator of viral defense system
MCLAQDPGARIRDVADKIGITERAVQRIVAELEKHSYLRRVREGRRNRYEVQIDHPLRHQMERNWTVADLLALGDGDKPAEPEDATRLKIAAVPSQP